MWWLCPALLILLYREVSPGPACRISEFPCRNGRCVKLNAYCDGIDDCGDVSDEPQYCTVASGTRTDVMENNNKFPYEIVKLDEKTNAKLTKDFSNDIPYFVQVGPEKWLMPNKYENHYQWYYNFKLRPDDVFVTGFPRSGNTLTNTLVWLLLNDVDLESFEHKSYSLSVPFIEYKMMISDQALAVLEEAREPKLQRMCANLKAHEKLIDDNPARRIIKTHLPLKLLPGNLVKTCKVIYIFRKPKDVIVSYYHLQRLMGGRSCDGDGTFENYYENFEKNLVCNRTYYGDVSKTYDLRVIKSTETRLPFLCHLTFTANGQSHGDIVQLIFDEFKVGRYEAAALDGCPDGYMQLSELGRPFTGGSWCGSGSGPAAYYSETSTVTVTVKLFGPQAHAVPFKFRLRYRFVSRREAVVRFGPPAAPLERGQVAPGTYCTRQFEECYRRPCRLQSPNYPGMYPRNVSCYWSLRQKFVPTCKHAMIAVRQEAAHKMHMKRSITNVAGLNKTARALRAWRDCTGERDHLIFYDGGSTDDPVLAKYCGGDWLPRVVSRGPEMLVAFHSSPFSAPLHSPPAHSPLRGFELDVDVIFADSDSLDYSRHLTKCEFDVNATNPDSDEIWTGRGRRGRLVSPRHSLPPNTTCTYRFRGHQHDLIWLSFVSYSQRALLVGENAHALLTNSSASGTGGGPCATRLRIWDGALLLEDRCDEPPKLCDHSALSNLTRTTRPCNLDESYLSSGRTLVLQHHTEDGTALHPASFKVKYEFVDRRLGGEGLGGRDTGPCHRVFRSQKDLGDILSPRDVFLYGRGGAKDLNCIYRFEAGPGERVRLILNNASFGLNPSCETVPDPHSGRMTCDYYGGAMGSTQQPRLSELSLWEVPWRDVRMPRACLCDNSSMGNGKPLVFLSSSRTLEIHFVAKDMNVSEDFTSLHFHATFETVRMAECPRKQRVRGYGGDVQFNNPPADRAEVLCTGLPWLVESRHNRSLFLLSWGAFLPLKPRPDEPTRCPSANRVLIYSGPGPGLKPKLIRVVCPAEPGARPLAVHVFSEEWWGDAGGSASAAARYQQRSPSFLVEWIAVEPGVSAFSWLEISRSRSSLLQQLQVPTNLSAAAGGADNETDLECPHKCPELDACIGAELWCDGKDHCPSGWDESEAQCGAASRLLTALPGAAALAAAAAVICSVMLLICLALHRLRVRRRRRLAKKKLLVGPRGLLEDGQFNNSSS